MSFATNMRRCVVAVLAAGAVLAASVPSASADVSQPDWCPVVEGRRVECGTLTVPLVRADPSQGSTRIAYALVRRTGTGRPAAGTVVPVPGGPGEPAISQVDLFAQQTAALRADHDLLLIDPRGVGRSETIECGLPDDLYLLSRERYVAEIGKCGRALGARARGYTSAESADDIDAVRARLGVDRVDLYGVSYGTYLSTVYAHRHPDRVRRIVLSGAYPLASDPLGRSSARAVPDILGRLCARSGTCRGGEAVADLRTLAARLRKDPIRFTARFAGRSRTVAMDERMLALLHYYVAGSGGTPAAWSELPAAVGEAARGKPAALVAMTRQTVEMMGTLPPEARSSRAQSVAVLCNDYPVVWDRRSAVPARRASFQRALRRADGTFGPFSTRGWTAAVADSADACLRWPRETPRAPRYGAAPDLPVLVLSGDLDTNTTLDQGRRAAAQFPDATFVKVPNAGHVPTGEKSGCVARLAADFIRTGELRGTACLSRIPALPVRPVR
ncbi:alpha/beta fold hydrolase [Microtetraspora fusca]|uniref:alpha/beta fold hydrolase n=1 Tax=Microtetraspora fusca TaxID=1997 RepID=UPI0012F80E12|nr:alpha/beta fold hydrolase [Microtetraspora fusca]